MKIDVRIERIVLEDFHPSGAATDSLRDALGLELTRLLSQRELVPSLARGGSIARLKAPDMNVGTSSAAAVGVPLARSIHAAIGNEFTAPSAPRNTTGGKS
jgi:hypothetical protein